MGRVLDGKDAAFFRPALIVVRERSLAEAD
jgi:hypothetical protein